MLTNNGVLTPKTAPPNGALDSDVVSQIIGARLKQIDIKQILATLGTHDHAAFTDKLADILRKTSALLEVSRRVGDSLSLDVLLPRMVETISEFLAAERCTLFLYDENTQELYSRLAQGDPTEEIRFAAAQGIAGSVFTTGESQIIFDAYADPRFNAEIDKRTGFRTRNILCTPIRTSEGHVIGVAQVLNKRDSDFDAADMGLLNAITSQAAAAFVNAQLHEQMRRAQQEEATLLEVTTIISKELQLEPLLRKIMETVTQILHADRSTLFMYDAKRKELWSTVAQGTVQIRFPCHLGIAGSVFTSGQTINIPDAYADARFNKDVDKRTGYKTDSMLCMPVINKSQESIGVIQVLNKKGGPFTATDERRLRAFASQASIAIENAKLFEDVVNIKNYNESILQSMSNGVISLDAEGTIVKANTAALRVFRREQDAAAIIGQKAADVFFFGKNAWVMDAIARVEKTEGTETALDTDLYLREDHPGQAPEDVDRRRAVASVNLSIVPLKNAKREHIGCMTMFEDITKEKRLKGTMARYMTKELADKLLEEGAEAVLGGKLQTATVLFTDIRSFTTISEHLGAQETVKMLNEYFSIMVDVIMANGGILDKYIGDAIMAVFGAPFAGEEDADHAVQTAIDMLRALREFNARRATQGQDPVLMGVGINTDEVLSGNIGSLKRMDYTVIGDGVNLASRLEGANKPYGTSMLVSEFTMAALKKTYSVREVDKIRVKGKNAPVGVFEVLDHVTEAEFPNLQATLALFGRGLAEYRQQDWPKAAATFAAVLQENPHDKVSHMYRDRCLYLQQQPPAPDWDGVWTMHDK